MSQKPIFAIVVIAFALTSVAEAAALDRRNSAAKTTRSSAAATSPKKKADSAEDRLQKIMNICRCSDIPKGQY